MSIPEVVQTNPALNWVYRNLFSSYLNVALTLISVAILWYIVPALVNWAFIDATWSGTTSDSCKIINENGDKVDGPGACWTFVKIRWPQFLFGLWYTRNFDQAWRPVLAFLLALAIIIMLVGPWFGQKTRRRISLGTLVFFPFVAYALLNGSWLGLPVATTSDWGGLTLTLVLAATGIIISLPIGVILALGRRSDLPIIKGFSVLWIELIRGMPLITLLFVASVMLPYFLPLGTEIDKVFRAMIVITLFQAAYAAEAIRGGFAAVPRGQYEASSALGLGYWRTNIFVTLPQALKVSIPALVNSCIELFKDTSLVLIIGLLELLNMVQVAARSPEWKGYDSEAYIFAAVLFFLFCYAMARFSQGLERRLDKTDNVRRVQQA